MTADRERTAHAADAARSAQLQEGVPEVRRELRQLGNGLKLGDGLLVAVARQDLQDLPPRRLQVPFALGGAEGELGLGEG